MTTSEQNLSAFLGREPWGSHAGAHVAFAAYRSYGELHNLLCSVIFDVHAPDGSEDPTTVEVDSLVVHRRWCEAKRIGEILASLSDSDPVTLELGEHDLVLNLAGEGYNWLPITDDDLAFNTIGWRSSVFTGMGPAIQEYVPIDIYWQLAKRIPGGQPISFQNWNEVADWVRPGRVVTPGQSALVEVFIPTFARLHVLNVRKHDGKATVAVIVPGDLDRESVAVVARPNQTDHDPWRIAGDDWQPGDEEHVWVAELDLPPDAGCVTAELLVDGTRIQTWTAGSPPTPVRVYAGLDPQLKWLAKHLQLIPGGPRERFEPGVANLLNLAQIATAHYGYDELPTFVDLVGSVQPTMLGTPHLYLVGECTTAPPAVTKIEKLAGRAQTIASSLGHSHPTVQFLPVMFTSVEATAVPTESWNAAQRHRVVIVPKERVQELHDMVLSGQASGAVAWQAIAQWR